MNPHDELNALIAMFPDETPLFERAEHIPSSLTPEPYKQMLVHNHHMTVTMESYHRSPVDVRVLAERHTPAQDGGTYDRKILLLKSGTEEVVQFGIVRFHFQYVTEQVRNEILDGKTPLGHVLINHNVLRQIDLGAILRITAGQALASYLQMEAGEVTYGRLATIFCNEKPAVDLLEISAPLPNA
ncbi:MAG: hypothetical protein O3A00_14940 [Planctomycetota bacterium]|nr:hypothetical protein [Planctomycetota bacterium]